MSFISSKLTFEGPFAFYSDLIDEPGIYVLVDDSLTSQRIVDVGESDKVRSRTNFHEREDCWKKMCHGTLGIGAHYMPNSTEQQRRDIEPTIREEYGPIPVAIRNCDKKLECGEQKRTSRRKS